MKAIIYARFSPRPKESAERTETIESQIKRCEEYCSYRDYDVVTNYEDREKSGGDRNRAGLNDALEHVKRIGKGAVLVVYSLSRLSRAARDSHNILGELKAKGVQLASSADMFDSTTTIGRLVFGILSTTNEYVREEGNRVTSERMQDASANGRRMTRPDRLKYGWMINPNDPKRTMLCKAECWNIDFMFGLLGCGYTPTEIRQELKDRNITNRGKKWYAASIKRILDRGPEQTQTGEKQ